jgi:hypothetical protein
MCVVAAKALEVTKRLKAKPIKIRTAQTSDVNLLLTIQRF